jgi:hypothetical protein
MRLKLPKNAFFEFWSHEKCCDQEIKSIIRNFDLMKNDKKFNLMNSTSWNSTSWPWAYRCKKTIQNLYGWKSQLNSWGQSNPPFWVCLGVYLKFEKFYYGWFGKKKTDHFYRVVPFVLSNFEQFLFKQLILPVWL